MSGYTVKHSIDVIDEICNDPERYKNLIQGALNDARTHYESGNKSKDWYDYVVRTLSRYL